MQYLCLFQPDPNAPNDPEHRARMGAYMTETFQSGDLVATGGLGRRAANGYRVTLKGDAFDVKLNPDGPSVLFDAGGFAILEAKDQADLERQLRRFLEINQGGSVEVLNLFMPLMTAQSTSANAPGRGLNAGVIPYVSVDGASEASAFYQKAFGAKEVARMPGPDGKKVMHCHLEINGGSMMLADNFPEMGFPPVQRTSSDVLHIVVADGDTWWKRAIEAGCAQTLPFERAFWGDRYGQFKCPWGVTWALVEPGAPS
jgi:uncharacterized glyoxalase superfamily protein PhnB